MDNGIPVDFLDTAVDFPYIPVDLLNSLDLPSIPLYFPGISVVFSATPVDFPNIPVNYLDILVYLSATL